MKTPPEKHEQKLMKVLHLFLETGSSLCLSWEKSLRGSIPNKKVMTVMARRVITFSVTRLTPNNPVWSMTVVETVVESIFILQCSNISTQPNFMSNAHLSNNNGKLVYGRVLFLLFGLILPRVCFFSSSRCRSQSSPTWFFLSFWFYKQMINEPGEQKCQFLWWELFCTFILFRRFPQCLLLRYNICRWEVLDMISLLLSLDCLC